MRFLHLLSLCRTSSGKRSETKIHSRSHAQMYHMLWVIKRKALAIQFDLQLLKRASPTSIQSRVLIFSSVRFVFSPEGHLIHHWNDIVHHEVFFSVHCCLCQKSRERTLGNIKNTRALLTDLPVHLVQVLYSKTSKHVWQSY